MSLNTVITINTQFQLRSPTWQMSNCDYFRKYDGYVYERVAFIIFENVCGSFKCWFTIMNKDCLFFQFKWNMQNHVLWSVNWDFFIRMEFRRWHLDALYLPVIRKIWFCIWSTHKGKILSYTWEFVCLKRLMLETSGPIWKNIFGFDSSITEEKSIDEKRLEPHAMPLRSRAKLVHIYSPS